MAGFGKFRKRDGGAELNDGLSNGFNDGFEDGFDDDFGNSQNDGFNDGLGNVMSDGFDDGFTDGFDDDLGNVMSDGFDDDLGNSTSDGFNDGFNDGLSDGQDNERDDIPVFSDGMETPPPYAADSDDVLSPRKSTDRDKVDLKAAFATLFKTISDRFTGKGKPSRATVVDSSDASFASEFDSAVDEGFATPPEEMLPDGGNYGEQITDEQQNADALFSDGFAEEFRQPESDSLNSFDSGRDFNTDNRNSFDSGRDFNSDSWNPFDSGRDFNSDSRYTFDGQRDYDRDSRETQNNSDEYSRYSDFGMQDAYSGADDFSGEGASDDLFADIDDSPTEEASTVSRTPTEGSAGGVIAAIADALKKFRRRLPSFRPKVYVPPEPEYHPEQDGIGTPTLASDIRRILEEQNKPGETEQEYDKMRRYISTVSTDTRIRPGDIKQPDNIGEVRAAQDELYNLINEISNTNEQQRRRIGVYEKPPEEDPYNFRGINDDRQYYTDMDKYSFDMNTRYGFESEQNIDPGRAQAVMEYDRVYNRAVSQQPDDAGMMAGGFSDGFDDGFDDDFSDSSGNVPSDNRGGFGDGFDDDFDDDFSSRSGSVPSDKSRGFGDGFDDDFSSRSGSVPSENSGGFGDGFDDDFDETGDHSLPPQRQKSKVSVRRHEKRQNDASQKENFIGYHAKRTVDRSARRKSRRGI